MEGGRSDRQIYSWVKQYYLICLKVTAFTNLFVYPIVHDVFFPIILLMLILLIITGLYYSFNVFAYLLLLPICVTLLPDITFISGPK